MTDVFPRQVPIASQQNDGVPPQGAMPKKPQLDGVRALAVALVVLSHAGYRGTVPGGFGVTAFFFLSGYLITTLLRCEAVATGTISLGDFYLRRSLRILPPLYLTMGFAIGLHAAGLLPGSLDSVTLLAQATFLSNYADVLGLANGLALPLWSLAVEEHFYLVFPVLFLLGLGRLRGSRAAAICFATCLLILGVRIAYAVASGASDSYFWTHTRIDSILYGCCLALWRNPVLDGPAAYKPGRLHLAAAVLVIGATLAIRDEMFRETLRYSLQGCALFVLFAAILVPTAPASGGLHRAVRLLSTRALGRIGAYSYTIYLVHVVMLDLTAQMAAPPVVRGGLGLALTLVYAAAMHKFVERPAGRLRRALNTPARRRRGPRRAEELVA